MGLSIWASFNDIAQRILTGNKVEQKAHLMVQLKKLNLKNGAKILDFGCGTAIFEPIFRNYGLDYYGYDPDLRLIEFAKKKHKNGGKFVSSLEAVAQNGPYDLILANCCFHHIPDEVLKDELRNLKSLLSPSGSFLLVDILLDAKDTHPLRTLFRKLEQGAFVREAEDYENLINPVFKIIRKERTRSHIFSIPNPVYNDLVVFECKT